MKITYRILLCIMVLSLLPLGVTARADAPEELEQAIIESCLYGQTIDISSYGLTLDELSETFYSLHDAGRLSWYTDRAYFSYEDDDITGLVKTFEPKLLPASRYDRATYQQRLEEILNECVIEGMAQWQIALAIHDYLIMHTTYDEALKLTTGYDLLTTGKTVCSGYTEVYSQLLNLAGVPCVSVVSEPMEHTWNLVCIDGNWYHVDVTWDDPTPDTYGFVSHDYFLLTDEQISSGEEPHYDWVTDIKCTDTAFTDAFWRGVYSAVCFTDADTCYLIRDKKYENSIYARDISSGKETVIYREKNSYINIGQGYYYYRHYGLSKWNGRLWFCRLNKVLSMKPNGKDVRTEYTYDAKQNKRYVAGCWVYNDTLYFTTMEHSGYPERKKEQLKATGYHVHSYTQTVTEPGCETFGYTESACSCGITCQSTPTLPLGHEWTVTDEKPATIFSEGYRDEQCSRCALTQTQQLPQIILVDWLLEHGKTVGIGVWAAVVVVYRVFKSTRKKKTTAS